MQKEFLKVDTLKEAKDSCPWAVVIQNVEGGYMCFESADDAKQWENQK